MKRCLGRRRSNKLSKRAQAFEFTLTSNSSFSQSPVQIAEVNLYFFEIFSELAEIQFEVDVGTLATCVTRLERLVRNADAFIGIYPYPDASEASPSNEQKQEASKYFRLELDLALRSRKPALVFYDSRYGHLLECPPSINAHTFDTREILSGGGKPKRDRHRRVFEAFVDQVQAFTAHQTAQPAEPPLENRVGLLVPATYAPEEDQAVDSTLRSHGCDVLRLPWPPFLGLSFHSQLQRADWIVTDIGPASATTGGAAFLHGQFCPSMRLLCTREASASPLETTLFGAIEAGYPKDILRWHDTASQREGIEKRLALIKAPVTRISTSAQALAYFRSAALREEAVFLSYAGANQDIGAAVSVELKKRFRTVFDYRDGRSITPGQPWIDEVFKSLAASAIGIPLLSADYVTSDNCLHEAREMISRVDLKKMTVLPVKLRQEELNLPPWATSTQYARYWEYATPAALIEWLVQSYDLGKTPKPQS